MKTQLIPGASFINDVCKKPGVSLKFKAINPSIQKALEVLVEGVDENHVSDMLEDAQDLLYFYCHVEALRKNGFLHYQTQFFNLKPLSGDFSLSSFVEGAYQLSRFTLCRLHEGQWVIENPLGSARGSLSEEGWKLVHALKSPMTAEDLARLFPQVPLEDIQEALSLLASAGMITAEKEESPALAQWEFHDLLFHARSRQGRYDAPFGGTFRFKGIFPTQPPVKKCPHVPSIPLERPKKALDASLEQAMTARRSIREHGMQALTLKELGEFLWHCARVKKMDMRNDEEMTSRPYPGGGARYELEIYPVIYNCEGLAQGVYHYHPVEHQLCMVSDLNAEAKKLLINAAHSSLKKEYPQVLLMISARFQRVSWKYQSMAYAAILKNLGVLYQTMYLVATASGLAPCALGGGDSDLFCRVIGADYLEETSVGEFMLGSLPQSL